MNLKLDNIIKKHSKEFESYIDDFLYSKEGQNCIKNTIKREIRIWLRESTISEILSEDNGIKFYNAIEKSILKRLSIK